MYTEVLATSFKSRPADLKTSPRLERARLVCATTPSSSLPEAGSAPTWPEQKTKFPVSTAWEYGPIGCGAEPDLISFFTSTSPLRH